MKKIYSILLLIAITQPCLAVDTINSNEKKHALGINLGVGEVDSNLSSEKGDGGFAHGIFYGYQYDSTWAINTGFVRWAGISCLIQCLEDSSAYRSIKYESYILNIKTSLPLSEHWSVFGKVGVNYYDSYFYGAYRDKVSNSGAGGLLAAGLDLRTPNGFGLGFEAKWLDMGDIDATNYTVNFIYVF